VDDLEQEREFSEANERSRLRREAERAGLGVVLSTKGGRLTMWRLLDMAGVYRLSFTGDALWSAFNEGQRNIGNKLLAEIMADFPAEYALMLRENKSPQME
jgi:hypothetical protein